MTKRRQKKNVVRKVVSMTVFVFPFKSSFVYVFDGLPRFLANGVVHSDDNLIGAFCGTTRTQPITVEATSGLYPYFLIYV